MLSRKLINNPMKTDISNSTSRQPSICDEGAVYVSGFGAGISLVEFVVNVSSVAGRRLPSISSLVDPSILFI